MTSILDAEDCWDIVNGDEGEPALVEPRTVHRVVVNQEAVTESKSQLKYFQKRRKKAASLITQTVDDSIVDVCERDPVHMWQKLATDYNKVTDSQRASARKAFLNFKISKRTIIYRYSSDTKSYFDK